MKTIPLTNSGRKATVDDEDYDFLMQWKWFLTEDGYAARQHPVFPDRLIYMHDVVWNRAHPDRPVS